MKITREEALKIAYISRISLKEEEIDPLIEQLAAVLSYAERVTQVADELEDKPSNRNVNFLREDVIVNLYWNELLSEKKIILLFQKF